MRLNTNIILYIKYLSTAFMIIHKKFTIASQFRHIFPLILQLLMWFSESINNSTVIF